MYSSNSAVPLAQVLHVAGKSTDVEHLRPLVELCIDSASKKQYRAKLAIIYSNQVLIFCVSEVRKLEAGTAFFDVWRYFETEKKALLREQTAAMLRVQPHEPESADSEV